MTYDRNHIKLSIFYPRLPGIILETYYLQKRVETLLGCKADLEEWTESSLTLFIDGKAVVSQEMKPDSGVDQEMIIQSLIEKYQLQETSITRQESEHDDSDNPDYQQWMNSVCSGE